MKTSILYLCLLCCLSMPCGAQNPNFRYSTTTDYADIDALIAQKIKQYTADSVLIVLDIDNTVLTTDIDLGGDIWYQWQMDSLPLKPTPAQRVFSEKMKDSLYVVSDLLHNLGSMHLTDTRLPAYIDAWQKTGTTVFALTARNPNLRGVTERELKHNNVFFDRKPLRDLQGNILLLDYPWGKQHLSYVRGVLMTRGGDKGKTLAHILGRAGKTFKAFIFVDDTFSNIAAVKRQYERDTQMDTHLFWYTKIAEDRKKQNNGQVLTEKQAKQMAKEWNELNKEINKIFKK